MLRKQIADNAMNPFTTEKSRSQEIGEFYVAQERRATDFEAPKLWKGSLGNAIKKEEKEMAWFLLGACKNLL